MIGSAHPPWGTMVSNYMIRTMLEGDAAWKLAALIDSLVVVLKEKGSSLQEYGEGVSEGFLT
ncbi:MAG: hypothetical protein QXI19_01920 [Candidatus Caldarchaeum sp.]